MRRSFAAVAASASLYLFGDGMARLAAAGDLSGPADTWNVVHAAGATFVPPAFLLFAAALLPQRSSRWLEPTAVAAFGLAVAFIGARIFSPLVVVETRVVGNTLQIRPGEAYGVYVGFLVAVMAAALAAFVVAAQGAALPRTRREAMVGAGATILALVGGAAYLLLAQGAATPAIDPMSFALPGAVLVLFAVLLLHEAPASSFAVIRAIFNSVPEAVLVISPSSTVTFANAAAYRLLSAGTDQVEGALVDRTLKAPAFSEEAQARLSGAINEVLTGRGEHAVLEIATRPPNERMLTATVAPAAPRDRRQDRSLRGSANRPVLVVFHDDTEMRTKEAQLSKANETKDLFISMFGHDLKAPLNAISGYSELVALDSQHSSDALAVYKYSLQIRDAAAQIQLMMENARVFSRMLDARGGESMDERLDIPAVVRREMAGLKRAAELKNITFKVDVEGQDQALTVVGSPVLRNVFLNLLDNAVKYGPHGSTVTVGVRSYGEVVEVEVSDEGPGVPEEMREAIFKKFTRLDQTRKKAEGVGIGLSIVRGIVRIHGGTVVAQARPDGKPGAMFVVRLPRRPV